VVFSVFECGAERENSKVKVEGAGEAQTRVVKVKESTYSLASETAGPSGAIACVPPSSCSPKVFARRSKTLRMSAPRVYAQRGALFGLADCDVAFLDILALVVQNRGRGASVNFTRVSFANPIMAAGCDGCWMKAKLRRSAHAMTIANAGTHRHSQRTTEAHSRATTTSVHSAVHQATTYLSSSYYTPNPRRSVLKATQPH
jgi:hypothetical protein